jgi:PadR family transcriptional regulator, regulatory protein AphA
MRYRYLILGLLLEHPMTGYALHQRMRTLTDVISSASYGTLYPLLHKMLADGDVEMDLLPGRGRTAKKQYRITTVGQAALHQWLSTPLDADSQPDFLLRVYLAQHLAPHEMNALIAQRRCMVRRQIESLRAAPTTTSGESLLQGYLLSSYQTELTWLQRIETPHMQTR